MATGIEENVAGASGVLPLGPYAGLNPHRFTVREFEKILDAGVFHPDRRFELLAGFIVEKMTKHEPHDFGVSELGERLGDVLKPASDWVIREEKTAALGALWRPEPDIVVTRGPRRKYLRSHPRPADIVLIIEVAETSYQRDRGSKWRAYARAGLPAYGILNIPERQFELYAKPVGRGKSARYDERTDYGNGDAFPIIIDGVEVGRVAVADLLA